MSVLGPAMISVKAVRPQVFGNGQKGLEFKTTQVPYKNDRTDKLFLAQPKISLQSKFKEKLLSRFVLLLQQATMFYRVLLVLLGPIPIHRQTRRVTDQVEISKNRTASNILALKNRSPPKTNHYCLECFPILPVTSGILKSSP